MEVNERKNYSFLPSTASIAGMLVGGFGFKRTSSIDEVLTSDKFELKSKNLTDVQTQASKTLNNLVQDAKKINENAEKQVLEILNGKQTISVNEFLGSSIDKFTQELNLKVQEYNATNQELLQLRKNLKETTEEVAKKAVQEAVNAKQKIIDGLEKAFNADKARLNIAQAANDGKITKDLLHSYTSNKIYSELAEKTLMAMKDLGNKCPKKFSTKMALLGTIIGIIAGNIIVRFSSNKKQA